MQVRGVGGWWLMVGGSAAVLPTTTNNQRPTLLSLVRAIFGIYLFIHFASLIPWANEVFAEVLPRAASPLLHLFPNILAVADVATPLLVIVTIASLFFSAGRFDRIAAIVMWYVLACLFGRNPLISNPSLPFAGWLLLMHALLPRNARELPRPFFAALWTVMSLGYTYSGWTKLASPSWVDGTAMLRVIQNPLARPSFIRDLVLQTPEPILQFATWGALALELLYAPLALIRPVRPVIWLAMLLMHLGLMVLIDFADLSFMMVIVHLYAWPFRRTS